MKQWSRVAPILVAILVALIWVGHASAITMTIQEAADTGFVVTIDTGGLPFPITMTPSAESLRIEFDVPGVAVSQPRTTFGALIESASATAPVLSDILEVVLTGTPAGINTLASTHVLIDFISDTAEGQGVTPTTTPTTLAVETGLPQTLLNTTFGGVPVIVNAVSDPAVVPEPGTLLLLGSGLVGLGIVARRLRRS